MKNRAFLFPGQGAQYVGMAKDFYETFALVRQTFEEASDRLGNNYTQLILHGPADELLLTKNSQVAIYIVSIALWRVVQKQFPDLLPKVCAGLSLGEYSALTASGRLSFEDSLPIVAARAQYMHEACLTNPGTMSVVLGMNEEQVRAVLPRQAWVANLNCPGQVVIAGTLQGIAQATAVLQGAGAKRVLPLEVSGPFHSELMETAREKLAPLIQGAPLRESPVELVMNVPGRAVADVSQIRTFLIEQVTQPVRWEQGIRYMMRQGVEQYIEIGCGKTLSGMNKRIGVPGMIMNIETVADLEHL